MFVSITKMYNLVVVLFKVFIFKINYILFENVNSLKMLIARLLELLKVCRILWKLGMTRIYILKKCRRIFFLELNNIVSQNILNTFRNWPFVVNSRLKSLINLILYVLNVYVYSFAYNKFYKFGINYVANSWSSDMNGVVLFITSRKKQAMAWHI